MKPARFLWILMVALLVPAMALSSCDKKKHVNRDDDDDDSSSGSKDSTEMVKKDQQNKKLDDITGRYEMDQESVKEMTKNLDGITEYGFTFNFKKNGTFDWTFIYSGSIYLDEIKTNLNFSSEMFSDGDWTYDKKQRILTIVVNNVGVSDQDLTFDDNTPELQAEIERGGGYEAVKEAFFSEFDPNDIFQDTEFKITELNADGFYARNTQKNVKVKFKRLD